MKQLLKKLVVVFFVILTLFCGSTVFADGAPSYRKNLCTVVVNNPDGAKVYNYESSMDVSGRILIEKGTLPYGSMFTVDTTFNEAGVTYLGTRGNGDDGNVYDVISSADVEIYGDPVSPSDLRFKRRR